MVPRRKPNSQQQDGASEEIGGNILRPEIFIKEEEYDEDEQMEDTPEVQSGRSSTDAQDQSRTRTSKTMKRSRPEDMDNILLRTYEEELRYAREHLRAQTNFARSAYENRVLSLLPLIAAERMKLGLPPSKKNDFEVDEEFESLATVLQSNYDNDDNLNDGDTLTNSSEQPTSSSTLAALELFNSTFASPSISNKSIEGKNKVSNMSFGPKSLDPVDVSRNFFHDFLGQPIPSSMASKRFREATPRRADIDVDSIVQKAQAHRGTPFEDVYLTLAGMAAVMNCEFLRNERKEGGALVSKGDTEQLITGFDLTAFRDMEILTTIENTKYDLVACLEPFLALRCRGKTADETMSIVSNHCIHKLFDNFPNALNYTASPGGRYTYCGDTFINGLSQVVKIGIHFDQINFPDSAAKRNEADRIDISIRETINRFFNRLRRDAAKLRRLPQSVEKQAELTPETSIDQTDNNFAQ